MTGGRPMHGGPWREGRIPNERDSPLLQNIHRTCHNGFYSVLFSEDQTAWGPVLHLWIRNKPNTSISWAEKQRIKDELVGPERVAVEVFPARSRLIDHANMYHLWVLPEGFELPFALRGSP